MFQSCITALQSCKTTAKKCTKRCAPRANFLFILLLFLLPSPFSITRVLFNLGVRTCILTGDVKQRKQRSKHSKTQKNKRGRTKKKFTGSYTEVNPRFYFFLFITVQLTRASLLALDKSIYNSIQLLIHQSGGGGGIPSGEAVS